MISLDTVLAGFDQQLNIKGESIVAIRLPSADTHHYELLMSKANELIHANIDAHTGEYYGQRDNHVAGFLFSLHSNLLMGKMGRYLVGVFGVAMLLLLTTGVLIHRHMFRDLFKFRWRSRALRTTVADGHKGIGTWALLFHLCIAFTGSVLALKDLSVLPPLLGQTGGDVTALKKTLQGKNKSTKIPGREVPMVSVQNLLEQAKSMNSRFEPTFVTLNSWGHERGTVTVSGTLLGHLLPKSEALRMVFEGRSGTLLAHEDASNHSLLRRIYASMMPLHYGDFAGFGLQFLYFILGVSTCILSWTGMSIWLLRTRQRMTAK